jgi:hypothetical protein
LTLFHPHASPSKRIWLRLWHAVTKFFSKRRDVAGVKDLGQLRTRFLCYSQDVLPLFITEASSVRDQDVARPNGPQQTSTSGECFCFHRPCFQVWCLFGTEASLQALAPNRTEIDFTIQLIFAFVCIASVIPRTCQRKLPQDCLIIHHPNPPT